MRTAPCRVCNQEEKKNRIIFKKEDIFTWECHSPFLRKKKEERKKDPSLPQQHHANLCL